MVLIILGSKMTKHTKEDQEFFSWFLKILEGCESCAERDVLRENFYGLKHSYKKMLCDDDLQMQSLESFERQKLFIDAFEDIENPQEFMGVVKKMVEVLELHVIKGCNDTCQYALTEIYECNCGQVKAKEALEEAKKVGIV